MSDGYGSTQATNTWITSDGSVTNYDPNTEMGFWISALHNECDRSAHLEREIERLRVERDKWREIAGQLVNGAEHQIDEIRFMRIPLTNPKWREALYRWEKAVCGES